MIINISKEDRELARNTGLLENSKVKVLDDLVEGYTILIGAAREVAAIAEGMIKFNGKTHSLPEIFDLYVNEQLEPLERYLRSSYFIGTSSVEVWSNKNISRDVRYGLVHHGGDSWIKFLYANEENEIKKLEENHPVAVDLVNDLKSDPDHENHNHYRFECPNPSFNLDFSLFQTQGKVSVARYAGFSRAKEYVSHVGVIGAKLHTIRIGMPRYHVLSLDGNMHAIPTKPQDNVIYLIKK